MTRDTLRICAGPERLARWFRLSAVSLALLAFVAGGCNGSQLRQPANPATPAVATRTEPAASLTRATVPTTQPPPTTAPAPIPLAAQGRPAGLTAARNHDLPAADTATPTAIAAGRSRAGAVPGTAAIAPTQAGNARPAAATARVITATLGSQDGATAPTPATQAVPGLQLVVHTPAHVRQGPGTLYPIVGTLPAGATYAVTGKNPDGSWLQFAYHDGRGWVLASLVILQGDLQAAATVAHVPPPPPTARPQPSPTPASPPGPADPVLAELVARINRARADAGLATLQWGPALAQAAQAHAGDMAQHNFFSHTGSDGSDVTVRMRRAGYEPTYWGEILTHVGGGADAAFGQYWGSPHHHDIILGDRFLEIGAAWLPDPHDGSFNYYVVVFGRR